MSLRAARKSALIPISGFEAIVNSFSDTSCVGSREKPVRGRQSGDHRGGKGGKREEPPGQKARVTVDRGACRAESRYARCALETTSPFRRIGKVRAIFERGNIGRRILMSRPSVLIQRRPGRRPATPNDVPISFRWAGHSCNCPCHFWQIRASPRILAIHHRSGRISGTLRRRAASATTFGMEAT